MAFNLVQTASNHVQGATANRFVEAYLVVCRRCAGGLVPVSDVADAMGVPAGDLMRWCVDHGFRHLNLQMTGLGDKAQVKVDPTGDLVDAVKGGLVALALAFLGIFFIYMIGG